MRTDLPGAMILVRPPHAAAAAFASAFDSSPESSASAQVIAGHLVEAASEPVTQDGHTLILLEPAGAVEAVLKAVSVSSRTSRMLVRTVGLQASRVKIADPEDAALYKSQPACH